MNPDETLAVRAVSDIESFRPRPDDDDLCHIACCVDDALGLCGSRLTSDTDDDVSCVVCADIENTAPGWCPKFTECRVVTP